MLSQTKFFEAINKLIITNFRDLPILILYNVHGMPTIKQQLVASQLVENGGNLGKAMIAAGYSPSTAKTPTKLTKSKGWRELMDSIFPDRMLIKKHRELLGAKKMIVRPRDGKVTVATDTHIVVKALDMAFNLKGR